jgi:hypothetical protein
MLSLELNIQITNMGGEYNFTFPKFWFKLLKFFSKRSTSFMEVETMCFSHESYLIITKCFIYLHTYITIIFIPSLFTDDS